MTSENFNEKYKDYLVEGFYGLALDNLKAIEYLDLKFQEFIKIPGFKYYQIKQKFNWFRFIEEGLTLDQVREVELELKKIYEPNSFKITNM